MQYRTHYAKLLQKKKILFYENSCLSFANEFMWSSYLGVHLVCTSCLKWNFEKRKTTFPWNFVFVAICIECELVKIISFSMIWSVPISVGRKVLSWLLTQKLSFCRICNSTQVCGITLYSWGGMILEWHTLSTLMH